MFRVWVSKSLEPTCVSEPKCKSQSDHDERRRHRVDDSPFDLLHIIDTCSMEEAPLTKSTPSLNNSELSLLCNRLAWKWLASVASGSFLALLICGPIPRYLSRAKLLIKYWRLCDKEGINRVAFSTSVAVFASLFILLQQRVGMSDQSGTMTCGWRDEIQIIVPQFGLYI
jgi:hypothetical protein